MLIRDLIHELMKVEDASEANAEIYFDEKNKCLMAVDATYESCRVTLPESLTEELRAKIDD